MEKVKQKSPKSLEKFKNEYIVCLHKYLECILKNSKLSNIALRNYIEKFKNTNPYIEYFSGFLHYHGYCGYSKNLDLAWDCYSNVWEQVPGAAYNSAMMLLENSNSEEENAKVLLKYILECNADKFIDTKEEMDFKQKAKEQLSKLQI